MKIDDLTISEAKELASLFYKCKCNNQRATIAGRTGADTKSR